LTEALNKVSRALAVQPDLLDGWMLKGRLHWALMEFDRAVDSFRQAVNLDAASQPAPGSEAPAETLEMAIGLASGVPTNTRRAPKFSAHLRLRKTSQPETFSTSKPKTKSTEKLGKCARSSARQTHGQ
jgi:tetratricopeptide (TPR) repeat protein